MANTHTVSPVSRTVAIKQAEHEIERALKDRDRCRRFRTADLIAQSLDFSMRMVRFKHLLEKGRRLLFRGRLYNGATSAVGQTEDSDSKRIEAKSIKASAG
jgi:hypothetical protein